MKYLNLVWNWLVLSSSNPTKLSTTLKGSAVFVIVTAIGSVLGIDGISDVADHGVSFIVEISRVCAAGYALWGAIRKVRTTLGGTNAVLNDQLLR